MELTKLGVILGCVAFAAACSGSDFSSQASDAAPDAVTSGGNAGTSTAGSGGSASGSGSSGGSGGSGGNAIGGASGGASDGAAAASGNGGSAGAAGALADGGGDAELDGAELDAADGCVLVQFYLDGDGDGWGSTTTTSACSAPGGQWVSTGGDCDDGNADVHPGQTSYFTAGYARTGTSEISFDYDCSGVEQEAGTNPKAACKVQGLGCVGGGYLIALPLRSGPGIDPFCGSAERVNCNYVNLKCPQSTPYGAPAIACR